MLLKHGLEHTKVLLDFLLIDIRLRLLVIAVLHSPHKLRQLQVRIRFQNHLAIRVKPFHVSHRNALLHVLQQRRLRVKHARALAPRTAQSRQMPVRVGVNVRQPDVLLSLLHQLFLRDIAVIEQNLSLFLLRRRHLVIAGRVLVRLEQRLKMMVVRAQLIVMNVVRRLCVVALLNQFTKFVQRQLRLAHQNIFAIFVQIVHKHVGNALFDVAH
mmetsp:Transcript_24376/g.39256  ORF Transcript_24376/g.39256 Transcript_24376/m.39256 type:complete len:213 (-) Transcript_24376:232-870(-)